MGTSRVYSFCTAVCCAALGFFVVSGFAQAQTTSQRVETQSYEQERAPSPGGWRRVGNPPTTAEQDNATTGYGQDLGNGVHVYDPEPERQGQRQPMRMQQPPSQLTIQPGSYLTVRTNQELSSNRNHVGDTFTATLEQPLVVNGVVVASPGETVSGRVTEVQKSGRVEGLARLGVQLTELSLVDGQQLPIQSQFISQVGPGSKGRDAGAIAGTTGLGAIIGAAAGGGPGAAIGAGAGAAASTIGVLITRGRASVIGPEEVLTFRIIRPVTISTVSAPQAFQPIDPNQYEYYSQARREETTQYQQTYNPPPAAPYDGYGYGYPAPYYAPYASGYPYAYSYGFGYPGYRFGYPYGGGAGLNFFYSPGWYGGHYYSRGFDRPRIYNRVYTNRFYNNRNYGGGYREYHRDNDYRGSHEGHGFHQGGGFHGGRGHR